MYPRYHFLLLGWYSNEWWKKTTTRCSLKEIELALQHSLSADLLPDARVLGDDWQTDVGIVSMRIILALMHLNRSITVT